MGAEQFERVSTRAVLSFVDGHNTKGRFSIPRARTNKNNVEALDTMMAIINSGALQLGNLQGSISIGGVEIVDTVRRVII